MQNPRSALGSSVRRRRAATIFGVLVLGVLAGVGCSSSSDGGSGAECGPGIPTSCATGMTCSSAGRCESRPLFTGGPDGGLFNGNSPGSLADGGGGCVAESRRGEGLPLDMFVMMDRSGSMNDKVKGGRKWPLLVQAFEAFLNDPKSAGISVGIQYFALTTDGATPSRNNISCNVADYATAAVPIAPLPTNSTPLANSLNALAPAGETPTLPALQGAIQFAHGWATGHLDHKTIVVLATDGDPNVCSSTVQAVAQVAASGLSGTPSLPTYVIGVGSSLGNLNQIAQSGGTGQAIIVDTAGDTTQQFLDAMNKIRGAASVPCELVIPAASASGQIDYGQVNVAFTPSGGTAVQLPQAPNAAACPAKSGAWYYDHPQAPTKIELCPTSCALVTADPSAQLDFQLGCRNTVTIQ